MQLSLVIAIFTSTLQKALQLTCSYGYLSWPVETYDLSANLLFEFLDQSGSNNTRVLLGILATFCVIC